MSGSRDAPGDALARDPLEPWPVELRLLDKALEDGRLDRPWLLEVLGSSPYDAVVEAIIGKLGGAQRHREPSSEHEAMCAVLLDAERRTQAFDQLALLRAEARASAYVLHHGDEVEDDVLVARLVTGFLAERVSMAGALALLTRRCGSNEVRRLGLMMRWFEEMSEAAGREAGDRIVFDEEADGSDNGTVA